MPKTKQAEPIAIASGVLETAKRWGLSRPTMYKLLADPSCPAFNVGRKWVIPIEAFDEWMMSKIDERAEKMEQEGRELCKEPVKKRSSRSGSSTTESAAKGSRQTKAKAK